MVSISNGNSENGAHVCVGPGSEWFPDGAVSGGGAAAGQPDLHGRHRDSKNSAENKNKHKIIFFKV